MGEEGRPTEEPEAAAAEPAPADLESGPDSAPEVRGEAGRGEALRVVLAGVFFGLGWDGGVRKGGLGEMSWIVGWDGAIGGQFGDWDGCLPLWLLGNEG